MDREIDLAGEQQRRHGLPVRDSTPESGPETRQEATNRRRLIRVEADDLIRALQKGDLTEFATRIGRFAFAVAGTCAQFGARPEFAHYVQALSESLEDAQKELDRALSLCDWHAVRVACSKLELAWYGAVANLALPYAAIIDYLHGRYIEGLPVERERVAAMLRESGLAVSDPEPEKPKLHVVKTDAP